MPTLSSQRVAIDLSERQIASDRFESWKIVPASDVQQPARALAAPDFDARLLVRDEHDLAQRVDLLVVCELLAAIVILVGGAQHFDYDQRIDDCVALWIVRVRLQL